MNKFKKYFIALSKTILAIKSDKVLRTNNLKWAIIFKVFICLNNWAESHNPNGTIWLVIQFKSFLVKDHEIIMISM